MLVGHSLLSPLLFILAYELYLCSGSRSFLYGLSSSASFSSFWVLGFCCGLNFGLPPFLNFWVEVSLFSVQGGLWSLSVLPLVVVAFLTYLYSIFFYVLSCGGRASPSSTQAMSCYPYLSPICLNLLLASSPSSLLF
jgi:hypothetical protein